jgi:hypothetical protein
MTDRNDRIREFAYFLWLEEGCPDGQAERHWSAAEPSSIPVRSSARRSRVSLPAIRYPIRGPLLTFLAHRKTFGGAAALLKRTSDAAVDLSGARDSVEAATDSDVTEHFGPIHVSSCAGADAGKTEDIAMGLGRGMLLWLIGVPIPVIILIALIWHH